MLRSRDGGGDDPQCHRAVPAGVHHRPMGIANGPDGPSRQEPTPSLICRMVQAHVEESGRARGFSDPNVPPISNT